MNYIAAFDIGTTSVKGLLVDSQGLIYGESTILIDTIYKEGGMIEQDPEQWWEAVAAIAKGWWEKGYNPENVAMISFSGQMQDLIPVSCDGRAVRNAILYSDDRAGRQALMILEKVGEENIRKSTGNHFNGQMPFAKMLWMKENESEKYVTVDTFLISSKDYVIRKLTGRNVTDPTSAATTGMMDIQKRQWLKDYLDTFDINPLVMPELISSGGTAGAVNKEGSMFTGFREGTPALCGAGDAGATTIGAGAAKVGETYVYLGTTGWAAVPEKEVMSRGNGIFHLAHLPEDLLIAIAPLMNAGSVHKWMASIFGEVLMLNNDEIYKRVEKEICKAQSKPSGLLFLPYLNGERCPMQDTNASGCFIGLKTTTTMGDMCRAALEGVAMAVRQVMELISGDKKIERITLIGGGSRSDAWCQIIADVCKSQVLVPSDAEYLPALGSVSSAFISLGWSNSYTDFVERFILNRLGKKYVPSLDKIPQYDKLYEKYLLLYPSLKQVFDM